MKILIDVVWGLCFGIAIAIWYWYGASAAIVVLAIPAIISMAEQYRRNGRDNFNNRYK